MTNDPSPKWLAWAREIQALAQTGLTYNQENYDAQRYQRLTEIAAEITANHTDIPADDILSSFRMQTGYATPKVDVRGAVVRDGKILLVQERSDGCWCLPGGWADVGWAPAEMVQREVWEESGYEVEATDVIGVYDANRGYEPLEFFHAYKIVFLCEITGGAARPSDETSAVDFFPFDDLPPLSPSRTDERHLKDVQEYWQAGKRPAVFD